MVDKAMALIGICDADFVEEILKEIELKTAAKTIDWTHKLDASMKSELQAGIQKNGYARLFMYEKKGSGGVGIRLAAHFTGFEDIFVEKCYSKLPCHTRFRVNGYEAFDKAHDLTIFKRWDGEGRVGTAHGLSKAFAQVVDPVNLDGKHTMVLTRLVWNSDGWQSPSGNAISSSASEYYGRFGFGHEEWNFRFEHAINGFVYGMMMGRPKEMPDKKPFPIHFWASQGDEIVLVGAYLKAEHVGEDELERTFATHRNNGILRERVNEVLAVVEKREKFGNTQQFGSISPFQKRKLIGAELEHLEARYWVKCPIDKAVLFPQPKPAGEYLERIMKRRSGWGRYTMPLYLAVYPTSLNGEVEHKETAEGARGIAGPSSTQSEPADNAETSGTADPYDESEISYLMKARGVRYRRREFQLVNEFRDWLLEEYSVDTRKESKRIDTEFDYNDKSFAVEAKYSEGILTIPIRYALGQILEYNFYPGRKPKDRWIILLNRKPYIEDRKWVRSLKLEVPISLCWRTNGGFEFDIPPL